MTTTNIQEAQVEEAIIEAEIDSTEEAVVEKKQRAKFVRWGVLTLVAIVVSTISNPSFLNMGEVFGYFAPLVFGQMVGMVGFVFSIIFTVQLVRWVVSFINLKGVVKEIMKAHAKR